MVPNDPAGFDLFIWQASVVNAPRVGRARPSSYSSSNWPRLLWLYFLSPLMNQRREFID
jgi:hypothetical protein